MSGRKTREAQWEKNLNLAIARQMNERDWQIARAIWEKKNGWLNKSREGQQLRYARQVLQLTTGAVAAKLGIKHNSYFELEAREKSGSITLKKFREIATALDCEVEITIRPIGTTFSGKIWNQIFPFAKEVFAKKKGMKIMNGFIFASVASDLFESASFRRKMGWSKQKFAPQRRTQNAITEPCF